MLEQGGNYSLVIKSGGRAVRFGRSGKVSFVVGVFVAKPYAPRRRI